MSLFHQKSHALIVQKPFFVTLNTRDPSLLKENLLSNKRYPYSIQTSRVPYILDANTVSKSIVAYYCSVIIAASFSGFIIQFLMVILGVAMLVTSFFCLCIEMIHKLEGWKARNKSKVN